MKTTFLFLLLFPVVCFAQEVIPLYQGVPKGSESWTWEEKTSTQNMFKTEVVYNVTRPTITAFLPPKELATGTAVVVAPGGAFHTLSINSEGIDFAKYLNSKGIAAFVLKYRVVRSMTDDPVAELMQKMGDFKALDKENEPIIPLAMADGLEAMKYVRSHASEMGIDPNKIGFMGFSAGGTLTMSVVYNATDESRPNFVAPIYAYEPAIIGNKVPTTKTPIFVAVSGDDQLGMMPYSINIYRKWFDAGQPAELHIYEKGGHGFGMNKQDIPTDTWNERFYDWMTLQGYAEKLDANEADKQYRKEVVADYLKGEEGRKRADYANLGRYKEANTKLPAPGTTKNRVVFLGNSITDAWLRIDPEFFTVNNYVGRGISGQTSVQNLLRFQQDVVDLKPVAVVIMIGTNDVAENTGPYDEAYTLGNIRSMAAIAKTNGIKVILCSVPPATAFGWRKELGDRSAMIVDLNKKIKAYAESQKIPYVDYHSALKNEANGMDKEMAEDGVHPTPAAYKIMEELVQKSIAQVLKK